MFSKDGYDQIGHDFNKIFIRWRCLKKVGAVSQFIFQLFEMYLSSTLETLNKIEI
jgi:hypothetical protein